MVDTPAGIRVTLAGLVGTPASYAGTLSGFAGIPTVSVVSSTRGRLPSARVHNGAHRGSGCRRILVGVDGTGPMSHVVKAPVRFAFG